MKNVSIDAGNAGCGLPRAVQWLLVGAILLAITARALGTLRPVFSDEFLILGNLWDFVQDRTIIPGHTRYPSLYSYMTAPLTGLFALLSVAAGLPPSIYDFSEWMAYRPELAMWPARMVSFACWGVCVWAVHLMTTEIPGNRRMGIVGAGAFAAAFGTLDYSGYGLPDTAMMMWSALALLFALRMMRGDRPTQDAFVAGLLAGLAVSTKYSAIAIFPPLVAAALLHCEGWRRGLRLIGTGAIGTLVGFVLGTPGWVLAFESFAEGLAWERAHMARGHLGYTGVPLLGQLELLVGADLPLMVLAVTGSLMWARRRPNREFGVLIVAAVAVFAMAAPARKQSLHYLFVLYPVAAVLLAGGLSTIGGNARRVGTSVVALACVGTAVFSLWWGYRVALVPDSLHVAREWINARMPDEAVIAMDWTGVPRLVCEDEVEGLREGLRTDFTRNIYAGLRTFPTVSIDHRVDFLYQTEAEWLVTSSICHARFFEFGRFTRIRPAPESEIGREFARRRAFYRALQNGGGGWRLEYEVRTGNGPAVQIYRRGRSGETFTPDADGAPTRCARWTPPGELSPNPGASGCTPVVPLLRACSG